MTAVKGIVFIVITIILLGLVNLFTNSESVGYVIEQHNGVYEAIEVFTK